MIKGLFKMALGFVVFAAVLYGLFAILGQVKLPAGPIPDGRHAESAPQSQAASPREKDEKDVVRRTYTFSDARRQDRTIAYGIPKRHIEETEERYGFSKDELYEIYGREAARFNAGKEDRATVTVKKDLSWQIRYRPGYEHLAQAFKRALDEAASTYRKRSMLCADGPLCPDHRAIQAWQSPFVYPVYEKLKAIGMASRMDEREFITLVARFAQHLPYKNPAKTPYYKDKENLGFWPPVICLREGGGDCDSKSTLFAALFYHFQRKSCVLLLTQHHAFIGITDQHKVFPTDRYTRINGVDYLLIEMTSPQEMGHTSPKEVAYIRKGRHAMVVFE